MIAHKQGEGSDAFTAFCGKDASHSAQIKRICDESVETVGRHGDNSACPNHTGGAIDCVLRGFVLTDFD